MNESNEEVKVNYLEYRQENNKGVKKFSWVTDYEIKKENVYDLMRGRFYI